MYTEEEANEIQKFLESFDYFLEIRNNEISDILDIGCGSGELLFRAANKILAPDKLIALDKSSLEQLDISDYIRYDHCVKLPPKISKAKKDGGNSVAPFKFYEIYSEFISPMQGLTKSQFDKKFDFRYQSDFLTMSLPESSFDLIQLVRVLNHVDDDIKCIENAIKLLKPNKFIFVCQLDNETKVLDAKFVELGLTEIESSVTNLHGETWENKWWQKK